MANTDRFGNLVDENGHDILDDDFEGEEWELDEEELTDDFPFECEYEEAFEESYMTGDTDLLNEY
jgi:hypothetical protein